MTNKLTAKLASLDPLAIALAVAILGGVYVVNRQKQKVPIQSGVVETKDKSSHSAQPTE